MVNKSFFVNWFKTNGRIFPWRKEDTSPFAFLVTEMLLRQTRAIVVTKLWERFTNKYPDASTVARASIEELVNELKGLGLGNQRAKALREASVWLVQHHGGQVPSQLEELLKIPHVGDYTARAVMCFAFGHQVEIVDTNVLRLFSRYYDQVLVPDIRCNPEVWQWARELLPRERKKAQQHNYGLLDFTADVCRPGRPRCEICPLVSSCAWGRKHPGKSGLP
jgi:A/G-specific adenine glycosylase